MDYKDLNNPEEYIGKKVRLEGYVSDMPWQHLIDFSDEYPEINYIDCDKEQIVVYTKGPIMCESKVRIEGILKKVAGESKRPGSEEVYYEYQIVGETFECIED